MEFIDLKQQYHRYQPEIQSRVKRVLEHSVDGLSAGATIVHTVPRDCCPIAAQPVTRENCNRSRIKCLHI